MAKCPNCGTEFKKNSPIHTYCSVKCRKQKELEKKRERYKTDKKHREKLLEFHKDYYRRNKAKVNKMVREWKRKNPEKAKATQKKHRKKFRKRIRERQRIYQNRIRKELRLEALLLIGSKCKVCGKTKVEFHETSGKPHWKTNLNYNQNMKYIIEHHKNFKPLCRDCHKIVHALARNKNQKLNWEKIRELVSLFPSR